MFVHEEKILKDQKLKILFSNSTNVAECHYTLHESVIASNWFRKIKHLKDVAVDPVESYMVDLSDINSLYNEFCDYAQISKDIDISIIDQDVLNKLHRVYETHHATLVNYPNNEILYKFHKSIHYHEEGESSQKIVVGWGKKEGIVSYNFLCNPFYENSVKKNNLYLSGTELGKRPSDYYFNDSEYYDASTVERHNNWFWRHRRKIKDIEKIYEIKPGYSRQTLYCQKL